MSLFLYQLKQAVLSLKQKPVFVFSVVTTMGITLGALLCVLTLNYLLLVQPLPYPEQERLYVAEHQIINANHQTQKIAFSYPNLVNLYEHNEVFQHSAMIFYGQDVITSLEEQPLVNTSYVTPEFHQILASPVALGTTFAKSEALDSHHPVALLSYDIWQQEYQGEENVLGQKMTIRGVNFSIVGVLAKEFSEPALAEIGRKTEIWLPWDFNPESPEDRQNFGNIKDNYKFMGLLAKDINHNQAQQKITPLMNERWQQEFVAKFDFFNGWKVDMKIRSVKEITLGDSESITLMMLAGVTGLILIACANITNLFMSRAAQQRHQMTIHATVGASKKHLFKAMFAETSLLLFISMMLALAIAQLGFLIMQQYMAEVLPRVNELTFNVISLVSALVITWFLSLFFAKLCTRIINYQTLNMTRQSSNKSSAVQISKKIRHSLIASQVALAAIIVFASASLLKEAIFSINKPKGFETKNISTLILNFSADDIPDQASARQIIAEFKRKIEALPQVESIVQGSSPLDGFGIKALTTNDKHIKFTPYFKRIDHNYFTLIEQQLLQGENFTLADSTDNKNLMVVNHAFAQQLKADGDVIGIKLASIGEPDFKIIGIVEDITLPNQTPFGSDDTTAVVPRAYAPIMLDTPHFLLKVKDGQSISRQQLSDLLAKIDSRYSVFSYTSTSDMLTKSLFTKITTAFTTGALILITFMLAAIGLYGILSYSTQMRRFEIGTRMAIGAKRNDIIIMLLKENSSALLIGLSASILILFSLYMGLGERFAIDLTFELIPLFFITVVLIAVIAFFACYLPLRQYINQPPILSLKGSE